uniref:O-acetyl-ADP-ribose deacetylase MACROD2-like n=1 Tax=Poecilia latipinna TaxID=48699 RepID=A0A3B3UTM8_9TELE
SGSMSKKKKDWKTEKERLLQLDREDRRKEYRKGFTQLDDIPTWREENRSRNKEDDEKELPGGGGLGDKVSLYKGDITVLEVDAIVNAGRSSALYILHCTGKWELSAFHCFMANSLLVFLSKK